MSVSMVNLASMSPVTKVAYTMANNAYMCCLLVENVNISDILVGVRYTSISGIYTHRTPWCAFFDPVINGTLIGIEILNRRYLSYTGNALAVDFAERVEVVVIKSYGSHRLDCLHLPVWALVKNKANWLNRFRKQQVEQATILKEDILPPIQNSANVLATSLLRMLITGYKEVGAAIVKPPEFVNKFSACAEHAPDKTDYIISPYGKGVACLLFRDWYANSQPPTDIGYNFNYDLTIMEHNEHDLNNIMTAIHFLRLRAGFIELWAKICACPQSPLSHKKAWAEYVADMMNMDNNYSNVYQANHDPIYNASSSDVLGPMGLIMCLRRVMKDGTRIAQQTPSAGTARMINDVILSQDERECFLRIIFPSIEGIGRPDLTFVCDFTTAHCVVGRSRGEAAVFFISVSRGDVLFHGSFGLNVINGDDWLHKLEETNAVSNATKQVTTLLGFR